MTEETVAEKNRVLAGWLAIAGLGLPGLHRLYLGPRWLGIVYLVLGISRFSPFLPLQILGFLPGVVSVFEGIWLLNMSNESFETAYNPVQLGWSFREQDPDNEDNAYEVLDEDL